MSSVNVLRCGEGMGQICRRREGHTEFWWGNLWKRGHLEDLGGGWKYNIRMDLTEIGWEDVIWISQFLNGDRWRAFVDTVMKLQVA